MAIEMSARSAIVSVLGKRFGFKPCSDSPRLFVDVVAQEALAAIPDGWAKVDGEWVQLREVSPVRIGGGELDGRYARRYVASVDGKPLEVI